MSQSPTPTVESLLTHARWARSLARTLVTDTHLADDLAQDALTAALRQPPADGERARGWLARVIRNRVVSTRRRLDARQRAEPRAARAEAEPSTLELVEHADAQRRLVAAVLELEEPYKRTVLLRWFGDLPPREIARVEGVPIATVTSRLTRAHARLREGLERSYGDEGRSWTRALLPLALAELRPAAPAGLRAESSATSATSSATGTSLAVIGGAAAIGLAAASAIWAWRAFGDGSESERAAQVERASKAERADPWTRGLGEGRDSVAASTPGLADAPTVDPPAAPALRGRVVLASGEPAAGARVGAGPLEWFEARRRPSSFEIAECDETGRFEFAELAASWIDLTATHPDAAPSETQRIEVAASRSNEIVLRLRRGGRVHGVVLRPDGKPAPLRDVRMISDFGAASRDVRTDDFGGFAFDTVAVGRWTILTFPGEEEMAELRLGGPDSVNVFEHLSQRTLEIADGAESYLELGRAPANPLVVEGVVTRRGRPHQALLQWVGPGERALELQRIARTDEAGRYRVALAEGGPYLLKITAFDAPGSQYVERVVEAPAAAQWNYDVELPPGAIRGFVVDARGAPVAGASVRLRREDGTRSLITAFSDAKPTLEDGSFAFECVDDGRWTLSAHKDPKESRQGDQANTAEQGEVAYIAASVSAALDVRDGRSVDDVVIQLANGVLLRGVLTDERGSPAGMASVVAHRADGSLLTPFAWVMSDVDGAFEGPVLAPGEYWVLARDTKRCSQPQRVVVDGSSPVKLALDLGAGGFVELDFGDVAEAADAAISLHDDADREHFGVVSRASKSLDVLMCFTPGRSRIGPLAPGVYRLSVATPSGRRVERTLAVEAARTTSVDLR